MRGFSLAMRHFADRADHAFLNVRLDPALLDPSSTAAVAGAAASDAAPADAKSLATELSRLMQRSAAHAAPAVPSAKGARSAQPQIVSARLTAVVAANKPLEL
jgi:hypothetical protein